MSLQLGLNVLLLVSNHTPWFSYHDSDVMSPVVGQGTIQLQQGMMGPQEAA